MIFSHSQPALVEYDCININTNQKCEDFYPRDYLIISSSVVDWKDSGLISESGAIRVLVVLETAPDQQQGLPAKKLKGNVYFIHKPSGIFRHHNTPAETSLLHKLSEIENTIHAFYERNPKDIDRDEAWSIANDNLQEIQDCLVKIGSEDNSDEKAVVSIGVVVNSEGFVNLAVTNQELFDRVEEYTLCRQAFYYLKYLFHKHTHHDYTSESLTTVHRYNSDDESCCARNMISDLRRGLVDIKRTDNSKLTHAAGIASYAKSLVISCERNGFFEKINNGADKKEYISQELSYFDHVTDSLKILQLTHRREYLKSVFSYSYKVIGFLFLFLSPLLLITIRQVALQATLNKELNNTFKQYPSNFIRDFFESLAMWDAHYVFFTYITIIVIAITLAILMEVSPVSRERNYLSSLVRGSARSSLPKSASAIRKTGAVMFWVINGVFRAWGKVLRMKARKHEDMVFVDRLASLFVKIRWLIIGTLVPGGLVIVYFGAVRLLETLVHL